LNIIDFQQWLTCESFVGLQTGVETVRLIGLSAVKSIQVHYVIRTTHARRTWNAIKVQSDNKSSLSTTSSDEDNSRLLRLNNEQKKTKMATQVRRRVYHSRIYLRYRAYTLYGDKTAYKQLTDIIQSRQYTFSTINKHKVCKKFSPHWKQQSVSARCRPTTNLCIAYTTYTLPTRLKSEYITSHLLSRRAVIIIVRYYYWSCPLILYIYSVSVHSIMTRIALCWCAV